MTSTVLLVLLTLTLSLTSNDAAKILGFFPLPSISHQVLFRHLTQELAKRGHEVTVITTDVAFPNGDGPANLTEIDVHDFSYEQWRNLYKLTSTGEKDLIGQIHGAYHMLVKIVEMQLKVDKVQKMLKEEKFDLLLLEACVRPALLLSHVVKAPVIQVSSLGTIDYNVATIGSAWHPFLYPDSLSQRSYNLSIWEKIRELYTYYQLNRVMQEVEDAENVMAKKLFGPNVPTISELKNNVDLMLLNTYPLWDNNRPVPPSVVYMGGLHQNPQKELPKDLKEYLDSSKNGVVYISFGTNVQPSLLPQDRVQMMAKVFSQLPYDVLWKWDKDELPGRSKNIKISKWLPQSDLLRHPNIKVFITQGGLQSADEAITAGVPLIGVPMLGDQWYNVEKYVHHGIGLQLDLLSMTEDDFKNAILTIVNNDSFRQNIKKLRSVMHDQPQPPLERAVWWTEHVLRHGGARHLRGPAANMSWADYLELELVFTVLAVLLGVTLVLFYLMYSIWKYFSNTISPSKKLKKN
ncbi:UDP-glucuronosyltransferase 2B19-like [Spodoptera litura]|uniref:UDP-glucuronosyltransferase n=1 Tax=Spodoptera litura TaxID=69820 RepID=A0A9J7J4N8_SPOLT|nr:UDP-glucuronosyltransferase 2B19-like [Spodoptera litura]